MTLHAVLTPGHNPHLPYLVWLHGFLGSQKEWQPFNRAFANWPQLRVDLPGHGDSIDIEANSFADVNQLLHNTLLSYNILKYVLIGYSLGGRLAMYHACQGASTGLRGLVVEGANPGLASLSACIERQNTDRRWAQRFRQQPIKAVLEQWYRQPVFQSLTDVERAGLIKLRSHNNPQTLARMLEATSLGVQPDLHAALGHLTVPFHYFCGERDEKFRFVAESLSLTPQLIPAAGHNAHRQNLVAFSDRLLTLLRQSIKDTR